MCFFLRSFFRNIFHLLFPSLLFRSENRAIIVVSIFFRPFTKEGLPVRSILKHTAVTVLTASLLLGTAAPIAYAYTDSTEGAWYAEPIAKAEEYGLMSGYPDGSFGVGKTITRGEFVTVLCRMFGWETSATATSLWSDVERHWSLPSLVAAAEQGIELGEFCRPDDFISREEMAVMLVTALGLSDLAEERNTTPSVFADVTRSAGYIAVAYDIGMITGVEMPDGTLRFLPENSATREEAAAMLVRVYDRIHSDIDWLHAFYAFASYSQIDFVDELDSLSVGWARLSVNSQLQPWINSTSAEGNSWSIPQSPDSALTRFAEAELPYNLNVYADTNKTVTLADDTKVSVLTLLLSDEAIEQAAIEALVAASADYAGLTIDFEGLKSEELREAFTDFMTALRTALPAEKSLYVCVPPDTWYHAYDYRALGALCDKVILMAHDYQWTSVPDSYLGTTNTYSPVTPLSEIYTALQHITDPETGVEDKSKIALQISFGTAGFQVDEEGLLTSKTIYHPAPSTISKRIAQEDTVYTWDEASRNPYIQYTSEEGEHYLLWYEDAQSVEAKLSLAKLFGITGVSIWRLGIVPDYAELPYYDVWSVFSAR